jgi:hypothetical protein
MTTTHPLTAAFGITHDDAVRAIVATFRSADADQRERGAHWYDAAHALAVSLDPGDVARAAGIIAALSPQTPWTRNVALAREAYATGTARGCLGAGHANRILAGESVADVVRGPKTYAFALTIAEPRRDDDVVVIDRHALSVILSRCSTDADASRLGRKGVYRAAADAYVSAARILGVTPAVVQATTWVVWRETEIRTAAAARRERTGARDEVAA